MPVIDFPFGKEKLSLDIPSHRLTGVLESSLHAYTPAASEEALVRAAMEKPIGSPRLMELARGKNKIVILASDHTRPVPSKVIIPFMLEEIRRGNPSADVTILIATAATAAPPKKNSSQNSAKRSSAGKKFIFTTATKPRSTSTSERCRRAANAS